MQKSCDSWARSNHSFHLRAEAGAASLRTQVSSNVVRHLTGTDFFRPCNLLPSETK